MGVSMDPELVQKLMYSVGGCIAVLIASGITKAAARKTQESKKMNKSRYFAIKRIISIISLISLILIIIVIWGIDVKNLWVSVTGVFAMVAVAFFAVWSLVGNILAGIIIYFTTPFKINDTIEIMPDKVKGKVLAINTFYTVVMDGEQNYVNIPNSLLFQRYVKKMKKKLP